MSDARRFLSRFALAASGMLLLCILGYVGLGWAVWSEQSWLSSTWQERLLPSYLSVAGGLLPGDRDGDGVRDGYEYFLRTDPGNALDHPPFAVCYNYEEVFVLDTDWREANASQPPPEVVDRIETFDLDMFSDSNGRIALKPGEPLRVHARLLLDRRPSTFPKGFAIALKPPVGVEVATRGGALASQPVTISVGEDGSMAFDVFMARPEWTRPHWPLLEINVRASGKKLVELELSCAWSRAPIIPSVDRISLRDWTRSVEERGSRHEGTVYKLRWKAASPAPDSHLVEAARDEPSAEWFPVSEKWWNEDSCEIVQVFGGPLRAYAGPLKFRIVPTDETAEPR